MADADSMTTNDSLQTRFPIHLGLALLLAITVLWLFHDTARSMVGIWLVSATFTHAFLVPPIAAWLAWRRRAAVAAAPTGSVPWLLLPMAATCFLWLLGDLADVGAASQFALVALLVLLVPTLYGWAVARVLAFPLLFMFFAVPIGEFAVPTLQQWTADVTVLALRYTGIPVYREGNDFIIPSGTWSVIEACSGVRYLIACVMVGTLFAYLNYRSTSRRLVFVALSVVVPIVANWIRAYTIVMVGHLTGSPMILGVEHTTYGWFLFGFIVMIMFFVGARWAEPDDQSAAVPPPSPGEKGRSTPWGLSIAIVLLLLGTHAWAWRLDHGAALPAPTLTLPAGLDGWRADPQAAAIPWTPGYVNPSAQHSVSYVQGPRGVQLWVAYYRQQDRSRKLVSSINRVIDPADRRWAYLLTGSQRPAADLPEFRAGIVRQGAAPTLSETRRQRFWQLYWIGGRWTHNEAAAKIWQALDGLFGRGDDGAVLILSTDLSDDADPTLEKFARAHLGAIDAALSAVRDTR